jgi:HK97 family phage prohead protease
MNQRAYSTFEVKSLDADKRIITGVASTPSVDRGSDIVVPQGMRAKFPVPMLWMHDQRSPVGHVLAAKVTDAGIAVTCQFVKVDEPPSLKDDLDRAWAMVKTGLVRAFSIGFNPIESSDIEGSWGRRYSIWELLELSCCVVPMNGDCDIQTVKSIDARALAAHGLQRKTVRLDGPRITPSTGAPSSNSRAALGQTRKGVVRLGDSPGASGLS